VYIVERWPRWHGVVTVTVRDLAGRIVERETFPNLIVNTGLNLMRDALGGYVTDAQIHYVAIGTSATAPAVTDTQLVTSRSNTVGTGQVQTIMWLGPADSVGTVIAEVGWFAGNTAGAGANTGVLVAHVLYSHTHTNQESIQFTRLDTL
jgi:hypothetical protein